MKYIIDIPNEMVIKSPIPLMPYIEPQKWVPVSERLPEEAGAYLCTCKDAGRLIITLIKWQPRMKSWNLTGARTYWKVIAWMPLPEPARLEDF